MNILIVTQYFWPENFRVNDLALGLIERGHRVTVLTGIPNYPEGRFYTGYGFPGKHHETYLGIEIYRVPLISRGASKGVRLALNFISFALFGTLFGPLLCRAGFDVIYVFEVSPVTAALPAIVMKWIKKCPLQLHVLDLWPESLIATDAVRSKFALHIVDKIVRFIYRHCDQILVQSRGFRLSLLERGVDGAKIRYFPSSAEGLFSSATLEDVLPPAQMPEGFIVLFAGNVGEAQDFPTVLLAAEKLLAHQEIKFVIVGDGRRFEWVKDEVARRGLNNVHLLGRFPLDTMPSFFKRADSMLVTLKNEPIFALTVPAKLQSYMAFGKPVAAALDGEGRDIIEQSKSGVVAPASNPDELAEAILHLHRMTPEQRAEMGANGRAYYFEHFDREMLLERLIIWMEELLSSRHPESEESKYERVQR